MFVIASFHLVMLKQKVSFWNTFFFFTGKYTDSYQHKKSVSMWTELNAAQLLLFREFSPCFILQIPIETTIII